MLVKSVHKLGVLAVAFLIAGFGGCTTFQKAESNERDVKQDNNVPSDKEIQDIKNTNDIPTDLTSDLPDELGMPDGTDIGEDVNTTDSTLQEESIEHCGNGKCEPVLDEDCNTCEKDCGCKDKDVCFLGQCCTPKTCEAAGVECGEIDDGCGGSVECGKCEDKNPCTKDLCNGEGKCVFQPLEDGTPLEEGVVCYKGEPCKPKRCEDLKWECGIGSDECGGNLSCGNCPSGYQCKEHQCQKEKKCGDGVCTKEAGENCETCSLDCKCKEGQRCYKEECCTPNTKCEPEVCGVFPDGCGGKYICPCDEGLICCDHKCTDVKKDRLNCGGCRITCNKDQTCCNGKCVNINIDENNCGECGHMCAKGYTCCGGKCVHLSSDEENCGTCGNRCKKGFTCCKGKCVDTLADRNNCGQCGKACEVLEFCCMGKCYFNDPHLPPKDPCKSDGKTCCYGHCVDTNTDKANCGECGNICKRGTFLEDIQCCSGKCTNVKSDNENCGKCGRKCGNSLRCSQGLCVP